MLNMSIMSFIQSAHLIIVFPPVQLSNGLLPEFNPYHLEHSAPSHYSNFVSYVPTPKPEWKRYKQYTKTDLMDAIEAVRTGMTALQVGWLF